MPTCMCYTRVVHFSGRADSTVKALNRKLMSSIPAVGINASTFAALAFCCFFSTDRTQL